MANFKKAGHDKNEFLQYVYYKYVEKQVKPGAFVEETLVKSHQFVNSLLDETRDTISVNFEKMSGVVDVEDEAEKQKILTFKQLQAYLMRKNYAEGQIPESIAKEKREAYEKSMKKVQQAMAMYEKKKHKVDPKVVDRLVLYFLEFHYMMVLIIYECGELNTLNGYLMNELLSQIENNEEKNREWVSKLWDVNDKIVMLDSRLKEREREVSSLRAEIGQLRSEREVKKNRGEIHHKIGCILGEIFN